jgi:hypothetical protein
VAVAVHDLRRNRLGCEPERAQRLGLELGFEMRERAHGARQLAHRDAGERALEPRDVATELLAPGEALEPERDRLGVHAVRASHLRRVTVTLREHPRCALGGEQTRLQHRAGLTQLHRERGIDEVRRRHPGVHVTRVVTRTLADHREERDDVVPHLGLDRRHARGIEHRRAADALRGAGGRLAAPLARGHDGELHVQPHRQTVRVAPHGGHRGAAVALDHRRSARAVTAIPAALR